VLVGHVDHGKSTLLGRLIKEFGMEPVGQESLSSYTDIYEKEK
jgi:translation elongation factor EF-1alpha